jgi:hypothetical protein
LNRAAVGRRSAAHLALFQTAAGQRHPSRAL